MTVLAITIPGDPVAQGRPRARRLPKGGVTLYDPAKSKNFKEAVSLHYRQAVPERDRPWAPEGPVEVELHLVFELPKSYHRKTILVGEEWHTIRPDVDNLIKSFLDAGNGVIWTDDSQVCSIICSKIRGAQGEPGCTELIVRRLTRQRPARGVPFQIRNKTIGAHRPMESKITGYTIQLPEHGLVNGDRIHLVRLREGSVILRLDLDFRCNELQLVVREEHEMEESR